MTLTLDRQYLPSVALPILVRCSLRRTVPQRSRIAFWLEAACKVPHQDSNPSRWPCDSHSIQRIASEREIMRWAPSAPPLSVGLGDVASYFQVPFGHGDERIYRYFAQCFIGKWLRCRYLLQPQFAPLGLW